MFLQPNHHTPSRSTQNTPEPQSAGNLRPAVLAAVALTSVESQVKSSYNCATRHTLVSHSHADPLHGRRVWLHETNTHTHVQNTPGFCSTMPSILHLSALPSSLVIVPVENSQKQVTKGAIERGVDRVYGTQSLWYEATSSWQNHLATFTVELKLLTLLPMILCVMLRFQQARYYCANRFASLLLRPELIVHSNFPIIQILCSHASFFLIIQVNVPYCSSESTHLFKR